MKRVIPAGRRMRATAAALTMCAACLPAAAQESKTVYRCPGNVYTDALSAKEAHDKGCRTIEGAPITIVQSVKPRPNAAAPAAPAARPADSRVSANEQRARDSDARRILESELRRAEDQLAGMKQEYNNGEPERLGNERNYQKYLDRVAEMKAGIDRKEADVAAIKRELAKLPAPASPNQ